MSKAIDAVLQVLSRRNPMDDRDLMTPPTAFSVEVAMQASADVTRLRALLVEARDALRRVGNSSTDDLTLRIEDEVGHV